MTHHRFHAECIRDRAESFHHLGEERKMTTLTSLARITSVITLAALCGCTSSHEVPVQSSGQGGGGNMTGSMSYPNPLPQGNIATTHP